MTETRTADEVRAELHLVRRRIRAFETMSSHAERLEMSVHHFTGVVDKITPDGLRGTFGADNTFAFLVADALAGIQGFLRGSPDLAGHLQSLDSGTEGLLRQMYKQEDVLEQELAALEPPEPESAGLFGFWRRFQRIAGIFG